MIAYFPEIYPDELVYSQLARYYEKSGYMAYIYAAEELYVRKTVKTSIEFLNELTPAAVERLTKNTSMKKMVLRHTMFPYYARFMEKERRQSAFEAMITLDKSSYGTLRVCKQKTNKKVRYLRYCPLCVTEDREMYGETFWHREHQLLHVNVCPVHGCYLVDSSVEISSNGSPRLVTAEAEVKDTVHAEYPQNEREWNVARYVAEVFQADIDFESDVTAGKFLHSKMANTKYRAGRGQLRNMTLLQADFAEYYKELPDIQFTELWQLQKVMTGHNTNTYEVCLLSMFLGVSAEELVNRRLPEKSQEQVFDEMVRELHEQGLNYREIAQKMNAPYDLVKPVGNGSYGRYHYCRANGGKYGVKRKDWEKIDADTLPLVKDAIRELQGNEEVRPCRITVGAVQRLMGLYKKGLSNCPKCVAEIHRYAESREEHFAREVVWAAKKAIRERRNLHWTCIHKMINISKDNFLACLPYLDSFADEELAAKIRELV